MTAQQALDILKPIPSKNIIVGSFSDATGKCCGKGWINKAVSGSPYVTGAEGRSISEKAIVYVRKYRKGAGGIVSVNDREFETRRFYPQKTPKARVVALLKDMIKAGY